MGGVLKYSFLPELSNGFHLSGQSQPDYHSMIVSKSKDKNSGFPNLFFDIVGIIAKNVRVWATVYSGIKKPAPGIPGTVLQEPY